MKLKYNENTTISFQNTQSGILGYMRHDIFDVYGVYGTKETDRRQY